MLREIVLKNTKLKSLYLPGLELVEADASPLLDEDGYPLRDEQGNVIYD